MFNFLQCQFLGSLGRLPIDKRQGLLELVGLSPDTQVIKKKIILFLSTTFMGLTFLTKFFCILLWYVSASSPHSQFLFLNFICQRHFSITHLTRHFLTQLQIFCVCLWWDRHLFFTKFIRILFRHNSASTYHIHFSYLELSMTMDLFSNTYLPRAFYPLMPTVIMSAHAHVFGIFMSYTLMIFCFRNT